MFNKALFHRLYHLFTSCFALATLVWIWGNAKNPERITVEYLYAFAFSSIVIALLTHFISKPKMTYLQVWTARIVLLFVAMTTICVALYCFDIYKFSSVTAFALFYLRNFVKALLVASMIWLVRDVVLMNDALKKINGKLKKNTPE